MSLKRLGCASSLLVLTMLAACTGAPGGSSTVVTNPAADATQGDSEYETSLGSSINHVKQGTNYNDTCDKNVNYGARAKNTNVYVEGTSERGNEHSVTGGSECFGQTEFWGSPVVQSQRPAEQAEGLPPVPVEPSAPAPTTPPTPADLDVPIAPDEASATLVHKKTFAIV